MKRIVWARIGILATILSVCVLWGSTGSAHPFRDPSLAYKPRLGGDVGLECGVLLRRNGTFQVDVHDPSLGRFAAMPDEARRVLSQKLEDRYKDLVRISFDWKEIPFAAEVSNVHYFEQQAAGSEQHAVMRLSGSVPQGSSTLRWRSHPSFGSVVLVVFVEGSRRPHLIRAPAGKWSKPYNIPSTSWLGVVGEYLVQGFVHILPKGYDHVLFVLGLFLLATRVRPLLVQVSLFTLAHTVTLGLSSMGVVRLPPEIVEPLIALSIAYVGIENIRVGHATRVRYAVIFMFGLLHGMGFASVLADVGIPQEYFFSALLAFNIGVEAGQLAVLLLAGLCVGWFWKRDWYARRAKIPGSIAIASLGIFWAVMRVVA